MDQDAKQGILFSRDNWVNLTAGNVTAVAQQSPWVNVSAYGQIVCYVDFTLGGIVGAGYLRYYFQFSPAGTNDYDEEGVISIIATGELQTANVYRELTADGRTRVSFPVMDDWLRVEKVAANGGGDFNTTVFAVHLRAG